jgi:indole-3-glycerol phosphate synthase/phosphoribosylanthranilate isomerase
VLDEIVGRKRVDVEKRMENIPHSDLLERAVPTSRRFGAALQKPGFRFILECKKASPSEGLIRKNFNIAEIAGVYNDFADAVSVLTDEPYFQGSLEILRSAREILDRPILAKDFVIGPYQVTEARLYGADAALLILSILDDETYRLCAAEAQRLSMDILTEVHDEAELERAIRLGAKIIGINNRNLRTLGVDLDVSARLIDRVPPDRIAVCESGIGSHGDILKFRGRARVFLVGGALMKSDRLDLAARRLIHGGVKVCGLASPEDAKKSWASGAVFGGLIFAQGSRRCVDEARAREIRSSVPLPMVGVFVNDEVRKITRIASDLELSAVQLHGEEPGKFIDELRGALPKSCEIWKAAGVRERNREQDRKKVPVMDVRADRTLFDTFSENSRGGTGKTFDWSLLDGLVDRSRVILAGGVDPGNARRASELGCFALDVNSGVEFPNSPGRKDHHKIETLFETLRGGI